MCIQWGQHWSVQEYTEIPHQYACSGETHLCKLYESAKFAENIYMLKSVCRFINFQRGGMKLESAFVHNWVEQREHSMQLQVEFCHLGFCP